MIKYAETEKFFTRSLTELGEGKPQDRLADEEEEDEAMTPQQPDDVSSGKTNIPINH